MSGWTLRLAALLLLVGCGADRRSETDGTGGADSDSGQDTGDAGAIADLRIRTEKDSEGQAPDAVSVCGRPELLSGRTFRADVLEASHPTDLLNEFFLQSADRFELLMVIRFGEYHPEAGMLDATIGAASAVVGRGDCGSADGCDADADRGGQGTLISYSWALEPAKITVRTEGCEFKIDGEFDLDICASSASKVLGLKRMQGRGTLTPDGTRLRFDDLAGYLPESEAADLCIGMSGLGTVNFRWLMNLGGICAVADSDGDGKPDAYNFVGVVEALEDGERFSDEVAGPELGVAQCPPDTGTCVGQ
ncbi:MAG: hypothetical protein FJ109_11285 [Deltaproteobacteria bacterium]|nr:hypothetical protein [Deltaproteobacteria bacterium]